MLRLAELSPRLRVAIRLLWIVGGAGYAIFAAAVLFGDGRASSNAFAMLSASLFLAPAALCRLRAVLVADARHPRREPRVDFRALRPSRRLRFTPARRDRPGPRELPQHRRSARRAHLGAQHARPGSTFSFVLPAPALVPAPPVEPSAARTPTVLVCDDDSRVIDVVRSMLERRGYRVIAAHGGHQAIEYAVADAPDVILLDLLMPGMSGGETAAALKRRRETRHIPIVILSVLSLAETETPEGAIVDWVQKPLDDVQLLPLGDRLRLGSTTRFLTKARITPADFEARVVALLGRRTSTDPREETHELEAHPAGR